jgi:hypothetical protein
MTMASGSDFQDTGLLSLSLFSFLLFIYLFILFFTRFRSDNWSNRPSIVRY